MRLTTTSYTRAGWFLLGLTSVAASAGVVTYGTSTSWNAAVTAPVPVNFEGIVPPADPPGALFYGIHPGVTVGSVQFDIPGPYDAASNLAILGDGYYGRPNAQLSSQGYSWASGLTITFPTPVRAAAFSIWGFGPGGPVQFDFSLDTGGTATTTQGGYLDPNSAFLGLVSSTPFTTVTIVSDASASGGIQLDYVNYATVPEPHSWAMLSTLGLLGAVGGSRWLGRPGAKA